MAKQDISNRKFDPMAVPGLSSEAREAVSAAFEAMSTWRTETVQSSEKNLEQSRKWPRLRGRWVGLSKSLMRRARKCKP